LDIGFFVASGDEFAEAAAMGTVIARSCPATMLDGILIPVAQRIVRHAHSEVPPRPSAMACSGSPDTRRIAAASMKTNGKHQ
jgi:hypothetical protein